MILKATAATYLVLIIITALFHAERSRKALEFDPVLVHSQ
jgi:hypothetical protein